MVSVLRGEVRSHRALDSILSSEALAISRRRVSAAAARDGCSRARPGRARTLGVAAPWFRLQCLVRASFLDAQHARIGIDAILAAGERGSRGAGRGGLVGDGRHSYLVYRPGWTVFGLPSRVEVIRAVEFKMGGRDSI